MAPIISEQHGAEAVRQRLNAVDPGRKAYDKFFGEANLSNEGTARKLIEGHNEVFRPGGIADIAKDLQRELNRRPF